MSISSHPLLMALLLIFGLKNPAWAANPDYDLGRQQYTNSDWAGAITNFSKSIEAGFDLYDSYSYRAYAKAMIGDSNGAIADCNQIIKLNPNFSGGYYWRSRLQRELTNDAAALADFLTGMKLGKAGEPADLMSDLAGECGARAIDECRDGNLEAAMTNLNLAIFIEPTNYSRYEFRSWMKELQGYSGGAIADAYTAIKYHPDHLLAYEARAFARYQSNDKSGALEDCKKVLDIYAQKTTGENDSKESRDFEADSLLMKGLQDFINGDFDGATQLWEKTVNEFDKAPPPVKAFVQKWIDKAKAKLEMKP